MESASTLVNARIFLIELLPNIEHLRTVRSKVPQMIYAQDLLKEFTSRLGSDCALHSFASNGGAEEALP
jgi:hypothetical protein